MTLIIALFDLVWTFGQLSGLSPAQLRCWEIEPICHSKNSGLSICKVQKSDKHGRMKWKVEILYIGHSKKKVFCKSLMTQILIFRFISKVYLKTTTKKRILKVVKLCIGSFERLCYEIPLAHLGLWRTWPLAG